MKQKITATVILIVMLFSISACGKSGSAEQRKWNGNWSGAWEITQASGSWEPNQGISDNCSAQIDLDENGVGTLQLVSETYGQIFDLQIDQSSTDSLQISGSCMPNGDEKCRNIISDITVTANKNHQLVISGSYTDPVDGEGNGFVFQIKLHQ